MIYSQSICKTNDGRAMIDKTNDPVTDHLNKNMANTKRWVVSSLSLNFTQTKSRGHPDLPGKRPLDQQHLRHIWNNPKRTQDTEQTYKTDDTGDLIHFQA